MPPCPGLSLFDSFAGDMAEFSLMASLRNSPITSLDLWCRYRFGLVVSSYIRTRGIELVVPNLRQSRLPSSQVEPVASDMSQSTLPTFGDVALGLSSHKCSNTLPDAIVRHNSRRDLLLAVS